MIDIEKMSPREIVAELDKYIIGQDAAKRSVAVALRTRLRRKLLPADIRDEVIPKNILMIGPTGVGKTEIARRLTKLSGAPFIKVEATKFTEVGYVGRDVESMIRDLMANAVSIVKNEVSGQVEEEAARRTEERLLDLLLPGTNKAVNPEENTVDADALSTRESFRTKLRRGDFDDKKVELNTSQAPSMGGIEIFGAGNSFDEMDMSNISNQLSSLFGSKKKRSVTIKQAREILMGEERDKLIDDEAVKETAKERVEKMGIVFIDEIDKIANKAQKGGGPDVSREGVQRDILPIVEGSLVNTKYGVVDTSHILFIAAGAFNMSKPSDLIPELQGRFPVKVELEEMTAEIFEKILTQPQNALIRQYTELMKTEGVTLEFTAGAIKSMAKYAAFLNSAQENIGARRLHNIMETVLETLSFEASEKRGEKVVVDESYIEDKLKDTNELLDLNRYIL
jgi:ATP-dependent HslUV protease ATP-binding subunit HslU